MDLEGQCKKNLDKACVIRRFIYFVVLNNNDQIKNDKMRCKIVLIGEFRKAHIWAESRGKKPPGRFRHKWEDNRKLILRN